MNEIFIKFKSENISLSDGFYLRPDGFRGLVLVKETEKVRKKIDKDTKKPTGEVEKYIHTESIYQPTISKTLQRYLELSLSECKDIKEIKETLERVENQILTIKEKWKEST